MAKMTEEERRAHLQAHMIPSAIFKEFFSSELTDFQIQLMKEDDNNLPSLIQPYDFATIQLMKKSGVLPFPDAQTHWLAIAFGHPAMSDELLINFARQLEMTDSDILRCSAALGRVSFFEKILGEGHARDEKIKMLKNPNSALFGFAVASQSLPLVNLFIELIPLEDIQKWIKSDNNKLLKNAMQQEDLTIFNRLLDIPTIFDDKVSLHSSFERGNQLFIKSKLKALHDQYDEQQRQYDEQQRQYDEQQRAKNKKETFVFDIKTPAQVEIYFTILKNLITNNASFEEIEFLAKIPAMAALLDTDKNQLLRFALPTSNESLIRLLLSNEKVAELAAANNFYLNTQWVSLDTMPALLRVITPNIHNLNLAKQELMSANTPVAETEAVLKAISPKLTSLDLCGNCLDQMNLADINSTVITCPNIETLYLSYQEIANMTAEQRQEFKQIFPNLKNPIFIDENGNTSFDTLVKNINYANTTLKWNLNVPSLQKIGAFFLKKENVDTSQSELPESVQKNIKKL